MSMTYRTLFLGIMVCATQGIRSKNPPSRPNNPNPFSLSSRVDGAQSKVLSLKEGNGAWDRLSSEEREQITRQLGRAAEKLWDHCASGLIAFSLQNSDEKHTVTLDLYAGKHKDIPEARAGKNALLTAAVTGGVVGVFLTAFAAKMYMNYLARVNQGGAQPGNDRS